ncbi:PLP-dependent aminotransferase family protein, partial [Conexibacter sp. JD483]|uniref:aminotransferase-like domain-containing protein n=2 Tax=Conexibacter TaxID=191494 RepID=UPI00287069A7
MDLLLDLAAAPGSTLRRRAEQALREAVLSGRLPPGARLPSTRALATQLGVSRGVVVEAYAQLAAEGYLLTRRGGGTTVAKAGAPAANRGTDDANGGADARISGAEVRFGGADARIRGADDALGGTDAAGGQADWSATGGWDGAVLGGERAGPAAIRHDLRPALPALAGFPRRAWLASLGRVLRELPDERFGYPDPAGVPELRETLAAYLGRVRGVRTAPELIVVTGGLRQGLDLLWSSLATVGVRRVAVERPGWRGWVQTAAAAGLETIPLAVDGDGAVVDGLVHAGEGVAGGGGGASGLVGRGGARESRGAWTAVDAVGVTPAHQFPTGAVLSAARRSALVAWAQRTGGIVVEDDYDAEFRYDRKPIGSLQGLAPDVVVYGGSASKTLAPAVRIGWLALPPRLVGPVASAQRRLGGAPAPLEQLALADLIARGELDRHLRRQRRAYRRQRDALLSALAHELPAVGVEGAAAGLHAVLRLP